MNRTWRLAAVLPLVGCVYIFDGDHGADGHGPRPDDADAPVPAPNTSGAFVLSPPGAAMGSRVAISLIDQGDPDLDLRDVVEVRLRGATSIDVTILPGSADVLPLSVLVGTDGRPGLADLEIVRTDGLRYRLDDAFVVVADPADVPGGPDSGTEDTGSVAETDFPSDLDTPDADTPASETVGGDSCVLDTAACDSGRPPAADTDGRGDSDTDPGVDTPVDAVVDTGLETGTDSASVPGFAPPAETADSGFADTYGDTDVDPSVLQGTDTAL
ncbi:MAG: hypothetical protein RLZZ383_701 [Pseudomonadota bacterium]